MKILFALGLLMLTAPQAANAEDHEWNVKWLIQETPSNEELGTYFRISWSTLFWANEVQYKTEKSRLFCQPDKLTIYPEDALKIMSEYARDKPKIQQMDWLQFPAVLALAMKDHFPC